jgi:ATP adenylyltransferase
MPRIKPGGSAARLRLWAPWRYTYLKTAGSRSRACIFCLDRLGAAERRRRLVLYQSPQALIMLNRYPYNNGHVMVAPRRHLASLEMLSAKERALLAELVTASLVRLRKRLRPAGFNVGANLGRCAGAGFADHLHWHIVPRWDGDTSFMPVLSSTRVLSEHLKSSFESLAPLFKTIESQIF